MEESLKEKIEVQLEGNEKYTIDLSDRKVVIFCGDTYENANLIPQFIFNVRVGHGGSISDEMREKLKYTCNENYGIEEYCRDILHSFPEFIECSDPKEVSKLGVMYYDFYRDIEYGKAPYEQTGFLEGLIGRWKNWKTDPRKILISTHSPYVLNYMNVIMAKNQKLAEKISAYYVSVDDVECLDSIGNKTNMRLINTIDLSFPMEDIFEKYTEIESKVLGKEVK